MMPADALTWEVGWLTSMQDLLERKRTGEQSEMMDRWTMRDLEESVQHSEQRLIGIMEDHVIVDWRAFNALPREEQLQVAVALGRLHA